MFTSDPYFAFRSQQLAALAVRYAMPAITQSRDFPIAGGLMSYGGDFTQSHRRAGIYAGRILNGEKPSDLPVQLVTKVELFVNLKAANSLGHHRPALTDQRRRRGDRMKFDVWKKDTPIADFGSVQAKKRSRAANDLSPFGGTPETMRPGNPIGI